MDLYKLIRNADKPFLIAGPCVIENESIMQEIVETLISETKKRDILFIFKASYKKANRTSGRSPSGPGLLEGLKILGEIKQKYNVPIITDIHETKEIEAAAKVADILQIPSFLSRQTELITSAAKSGNIINIKKGQFMAPEDIEAAIEKSISAGNKRVLITERGTSFGYHNLVVDFRGFDIMNKMGFPVVYDVTHSLQQPSVGETSGGTPQYARMMARAAIATGRVNGLFIETHPDPKKGLSDAKTMLKLDLIPQLLDDVLDIYKIIKEMK